MITDDGVTFRDMSVGEVQAELLRLQTLAVAVGQCNPSEVPESVFKAWQQPKRYREDELVWLRQKYVNLVEAAARLVRYHDEEKDAGECVERVRLLITGSIR